ncbi:MAG: hypothetical protein HUK20_09055 [Fibrobacter sp.]|nr:hypothetical protein [Fibrobacter sp.]
MSANVSANPDEIIKFANQLQMFIEHLQEETASITSAYNQVGNDWNDGKYAELGDALESMRNQMIAFCDKTQDHIPHLHAMAERLFEYQRS